MILSLPVLSEPILALRSPGHLGDCHGTLFISAVIRWSIADYEGDLSALRVESCSDDPQWHREAINQGFYCWLTDHKSHSFCVNTLFNFMFRVNHLARTFQIPIFAIAFVVRIEEISAICLLAEFRQMVSKTLSSRIGIYICKTYQINKEKNFNILRLWAFNLSPKKMGRPRSATRTPIASCVIYTKICCSFSNQPQNSRVKH